MKKSLQNIATVIAEAAIIVGVMIIVGCLIAAAEPLTKPNDSLTISRAANGNIANATITNRYAIVFSGGHGVWWLGIKADPDAPKEIGTDWVKLIPTTPEKFVLESHCEPVVTKQGEAMWLITFKPKP